MHQSSNLPPKKTSLDLDHDNSIALNDLTPTEQPVLSPSPPPSFYRRANMMANSNIVLDDPVPSYTHLLSSVNKTEHQAQLKDPPPSIFESMQLLKPNSIAMSTELNFRLKNARLDPLIALERKQKAIQDEVQIFLDAQSDLLNQGHERTTDNISETGSNSSKNKYLQRENCPGIIPIRQPRPKPISLMEARIGIKRCMRDLIHIKCDELNTLEDELIMRQEALNMLSAWQRKISQAKEQIDSYYSLDGCNNPKDNSENEHSELAGLKEEERAVEIEIQQIEEKLSEMKTKHAQLKERINQTLNKKEARLSSYRGALRDTEAEVKEFLKNPPISSTTMFGEQSLTSLPPSRRTLFIAREFWGRELSIIRQQKEKIMNENKALKEGIHVWKSCVKYIAKFEDELRKQIHSVENQNEHDLKCQITKMIPVIEKLEKSLKIAQNNSWNLLICAVGAELEAFREGERILKKVLKISERESCRILDQSSQLDKLNTQKRHNIDSEETTRLSREDKSSGNEVPKSPSF